MALDGEARDEPGRANAGGLEQGQDAPRADQAELAARQRRRRRHAAGDEARLGVEIEGQADDVAGHLGLPERGHGCDRHSIVGRRPHAPLRLPQPDTDRHDGDANDRDHRQRRDRPHRLDAASGQCPGADHRAKAACALGNDRAGPAPAAGRPRRRASCRGRAHPRHRGLDHRSRRRARRPRPTRSSSMRPRPSSASACSHKAIAAGKHVYSEKPVAPTAAQGARTCSERPRRAASSTARSRTRSIFPACRSSPRLTQRGELGRIVGFRLEFGWWVFDGSDRPGQRPSWNYRAGRRRPDPRYVSALALRHRDHHRPHRRGSPRANGSPLPSVSTSRASAIAVAVEDSAATLVELEGGAFGTILSSWATRVRRDDLLTLQVDGTKGSARRRPASLPRAVRGADAGDRAFQRDEGHRRRLSRANGSRLRRSRPIAIPTASAGNSSCATSPPTRRCASDFAAGIRDVAFAEACHRSMTERTWIAFPPPGKEP